MGGENIYEPICYRCSDQGTAGKEQDDTASSGDIQMVKLYPEGSAEARFKIRGVRRIFFYCNRDGLFTIDPVKGVDDKESGYDDSQERRELEKVADMLFGKV